MLIASEVNHFIKRKRQGKVGMAALKVDMSKAYDCMEWGYLRDVMLKLSFAMAFVDLVLLCVSTVRYYVACDGYMIGPNILERGLRQGDPLSPCLFILGAEWLLALVRNNERKGNIHGYKVARGVPSILHLFFANDSFFRVVKEECDEVIKQCFLTYEKASGKQINFLKSFVSFSSNTMDHISAEVCNSL